jgi:hypothetical protein
MKIIPILMLLVFIQLGFWIFDATACTGNTCGNLIVNINDPNSSSYMNINATNPSSNQTTSASLWDIVLDPSNLGGSNWILLMLGLVGVTGVISVGVYLIYRTDAIILFPVFTALLGFGSVPIVNLYNLFHRETGLWVCSTAGSCFPSQIISILLVSPLAIWWIFACFDFWMNRSSS